MTQQDTVRRHPTGCDRREFLKRTGYASLLATGSQIPGLATGSVADRPPNILLVITDQQHIDAISAAGNPCLDTPAMDGLVKQGVRFTESYTPNPVCSPARSAIFTGRTTTETGVYVNGKRIRSTIPNLGQWFSEHSDYETVYAGKWHVPHTHQNTIDGFRVLHTGISGQGNLGDTGTSCACEAFLRNRSSSRPLLMVASFMQPHDICEWLRINTNDPPALRYPELAGELPPLPDNFSFDSTEPEYLQKTRRGRDPAKGNWSERQWRYYFWCYYRHVEMVDGELGRVLRALVETGQDENTVVVFTADHGEGMGHHQMVRKSTPYDEASKVPLVISWPGRIREGRIDNEHLVTGMDIMPTLCDVAGLDAPPHMRGASLRPLLEKGTSLDRDSIATEMPGNRARLVRTQRYKYITYAGESRDLFFDRQRDPGEIHNLAHDPLVAGRVAEHRQILREWERQLDIAPDVVTTDAWWYRV